jgi:hypothetical protein
MGFFKRKSQPKVIDSVVKSKSSQEINTRNSDNKGRRYEVIIHQPPWKVPTIHDKVSASLVENVTRGEKVR